MADKKITVGIDVESKNAVKGIDDIADSATDAQKAVDKLDGAKIGVDTTRAKTDVDGLLKKVDQLGTEPANILLTTNAQTIALQIVELLQDLDKLDSKDPQVTVKAQSVNDLTADLDKLKSKFSEINGTTIDIKTDTARTAVDKIGKSADGAKSALANMIGNSAQDLGALGGIAGSAAVGIGQVAEYAADAKLAGEGFGSVAKNFALVAGPIAGLAIAVPLLQIAWDALTGSQNMAAKSARDLASAQAGLAAGNFTQAVKGITDALAPWRKSMDDTGVSVKQATDFITGQTDKLPLNASAVKDATSQEHFLYNALVDQKQAWADNHRDLERSQIDQFNALRAVGGTTEAFLTQASVALPSVKRSILEYVAAQNGIPKEKLTTILTDADLDDVAQVKKLLDDAAKDRNSDVTAQAHTSSAEADLDHTARDRTADIYPIIHAPQGGGLAMRAGGGPVEAGHAYVVGENHPELFVPDQDGTILPDVPPTYSGGGSGGGIGGMSISITVNAGWGADGHRIGDAIVSELKRYERRNGRVPVKML